MSWRYTRLGAHKVRSGTMCWSIDGRRTRWSARRCGARLREAAVEIRDGERRPKRIGWLAGSCGENGLALAGRRSSGRRRPGGDRPGREGCEDGMLPGVSSGGAGWVKAQAGASSAGSRNERGLGEERRAGAVMDAVCQKFWVAQRHTKAHSRPSGLRGRAGRDRYVRGRHALDLASVTVVTRCRRRTTRFADASDDFTANSPCRPRLGAPIDGNHPPDLDLSRLSSPNLTLRHGYRPPLHAAPPAPPSGECALEGRPGLLPCRTRNSANM